MLNIIEILVQACVPQALGIRHAHTDTASDESKLCTFDPYKRATYEHSSKEVYDILELTSSDGITVFIHKRIIYLQQFILQRVQTPERLLVKLLAFVWRVSLVEQFLSGCCTALDDIKQR